MPFALTRSLTKAAPKEGAFEDLVRKTHKQAYGLAYRLTGNSSEAEDLVQESFLRAYRFFHRYDADLPFTSWLYRIMTNAHVDNLRRRGRLRTTSLDQAGSDGNAAWDLPDGRLSPDKVMIEQSVDEPVQNALDAMNPEFRTAVLLADVEEMAYEEIAEIMGTSVGTVRSRIHRGRRQLRSYLVAKSPEFFREVSNDL